MRILILGSCGFIGNHCIKFFSELGYEVVGVDILSSPEVNYPYIHHHIGMNYDNIFLKQQYDVCINASGNGSVPVSIESPGKDFILNCSEVVSLLEGIRKYNAHCKIIHLSSAAVYGTPEQLPVHEDCNTHPLSPYGWHKLLSEQICREYVNLYGLRITIVRPFSVFGPGLRKQLLWDIFQKSKQNKSIELWGTGNESRDFIYIYDLVRIFELLFQQAPMKGEVYNIASGVETSIRSIASLFCKLLNETISVFFNGNVRPGDPINWCADISKLKGLGFENFTDLEKGLIDTVKWLKNL